MVQERGKCANPECSCPAPSGGDYCSDYCQDPSLPDQSDYDQPLDTGAKLICNCLHPECRKEAPLSKFEQVSAQFPVFRVVSGSAGLNPMKGPRITRARVCRAVSILIGLLVVGLSGLVYINYRRDIHRARERVSTGSQIVQTPCDPIEYALAGDGPPVLLVGSQKEVTSEMAAFLK